LVVWFLYLMCVCCSVLGCIFWLQWVQNPSCAGCSVHASTQQPTWLGAAAGLELLVWLLVSTPGSAAAGVLPGWQGCTWLLHGCFCLWLPCGRTTHTFCTPAFEASLYQFVTHVQPMSAGPTPTQHICSTQAGKVVLVVCAAFQYQQQFICSIDCYVINEVTEALYAG
jgi:hypothetical protein